MTDTQTMAIETLLLPFSNETLEWKEKTLFINAQSHHNLPQNIECVQWFKPYTTTLEQNGYQTSPNIPDAAEHYDLILIALPQNITDSENLINNALYLLKKNGTLVCAAHNKAGGTRIEKQLKNAKLKTIQSLSKNKSRTVWGNKTAPAPAPKPTIQTINNFQTVPGIYGWNKIDKGSALLTKHMPKDFKGHGADFGCGYGFLSQHVLESCPKIKSLTCIDADHRALECAKLNLKNHPQANFIWNNLTQSTTLKNLDFIIMNPPFHEGKKANTEIGKAFIQNAHLSLKKHGTLYMVANAHLPYEDTLNQNFFKTEKLFEGQGFKIYKTVK